MEKMPSITKAATQIFNNTNKYIILKIYIKNMDSKKFNNDEKYNGFK